jgi:hypothetical protein
MGLLNNYINKKIGEYLTREVPDIDPSATIVRDEHFKLLENRCWFMASNANELENFYKTTQPAGRIFSSQSFYHKVQGKVPRVHIAIPKLITKTIVGLVFSEAPELTISTGNEATDEELNEQILDTLKENNRNSFFSNMAAQMSYSGAVGIKFVMDTDVSDKVIFQSYPKEDLEIERKYGRLTEVIFKDYFDDGYVLKSHYGKGYIHYELFDKANKIQPLDKLEETASLKDIEFTNSKEIMAVYIENNGNGESDYEGCLDQFELIDEIKSTMLYIERALKPKRGVPSGLCEIDRDSGKTVLPNSWDVEEVLLEVEDPEQKIKNMSDMVFNSADLTSYENLYNDTLKSILNIVGLSQSTIGENDGGSNSSSLALNIREKASLRKRSNLILLYDEALQKLAKLILQYNMATWGDGTVVFPEIEGEFSCDFSEYASPSYDDMVKTLSAALQAGLISQREAIHELYDGDMSDEDQEAMLAEIKSERTQSVNMLNGMANNLKQQREAKSKENVKGEEK